MSQADVQALLRAVAAELTDIRAGLQGAGDLVSEILKSMPPEQRLAYLARSQAFDVLAQRLDALGGLAAAVAEDQPLDTALAALPLAEMAERLQEAAHRGRAPDADDRPPSVSGDVLLFD